MGRLRKKKIDEIAKLMSEGYTQLEVAQKTGVSLKTVRKYDPGSISGSAKEWRELQSLPERVKKLEEIVKTLSAIAWTYRIDKDYEFSGYCTKCDNVVIIEWGTDKKTRESYGHCPECGTRIPYAKYLMDGPLADVLTEET
jgi:transcriptional regulator with XRE-family HTH domain